jgi:hypothetical protein
MRPGLLLPYMTFSPMQKVSEGVAVGFTCAGGCLIFQKNFDNFLRRHNCYFFKWY